MLLAVFLVVVFFDARHKGHLDISDSHQLIRGSRFALRCLGDGNFVGCGHDTGSVQTDVFPYPLLQYLPSGLLVGLGASDANVLAGLGLISFVAVATALLVVVVTFRDRPRHGALAVLAVISSSAVYHATSAFAEGLVASLVVMAVCAGVRRHPAAIFVCVLVASLGKETLAPFAVALVLICARSPEDGLLPPKRVTLATVAAGSSAIVLNAMFNVFRFGGVQNLLYLQPELRTPGVVQKLEFFSGIFASPSSGVFWFWPFFSALALAGTAIGIYRAFNREMLHSWLPVLSVTGVMMLWFAGLSSWFSPFGWIAYGPRLEVPLLGGLAVAYVQTVGDAIIRGVQRSLVARISGVALLLIGSIQFFSPWRYGEALGQLNLGRGSCPPLTNLDIGADPVLYYRCVDELVWRIRPNVLDDVVDFGLSWSTVGWLAAIGGSLFLWRVIATPTGRSSALSLTAVPSLHRP